jgi:hypothetical protein
MNRQNSLLCYTLSGTQPLLGTNDIRNPKHFCQIYVCAETIRSMAASIRRHMPDESIGVCEIATESRKGWPPNMRHVKPSPGVWAVKHACSITIYQMIEGKPNELD